MSEPRLKIVTLVYLLLFGLNPAPAYEKCDTYIPHAKLTDCTGLSDTCRGKVGSICYYECDADYEENPVLPSLMCNQDGTWNATTEHLCFSSAEIDKLCSYLESAWVRYALVGLMAVGTIAAIPAILALLGFGPIGPIAGGFAAAWMANQGVVAAGGLFAFLQALAMTGISIYGKIGITTVLKILFDWLLYTRCSDDSARRTCSKNIPHVIFDDCSGTVGSICYYTCEAGYRQGSEMVKCLSNLQWNAIECGYHLCIPA